MQPTRAAESAWKTGPHTGPVVHRSRSAPIAAGPHVTNSLHGENLNYMPNCFMPAD